MSYQVKYSDAHQRFIDLYKSIDVSIYDPYPIDWVREFSPIEYMAWCEIRNYGLPLWPQYPIDRYRADFADPIKKIIIECDGKNFHDEATDSIRDNWLSSNGWSVYRLTGRECNFVIDLDDEVFDDRIDEKLAIYKYSEWLAKSAAGFMASLAYGHYGIRHVSEKSKFSETFENEAGSSLARRSRGFI